MRFHHLAMTAFGPYAASQSIDFEELNEAGIFLLTGPTGAGKTSILDALCFALYGVVPGVREVRTLRSHHAAEGVAPEVVLELTLGSRRYRVRRSPEWHRPKKRGEGTTRENACATLCEIEADGTERLVSSRVAEVGHELTMALGMSSEQFMQVVMLPQGDFQRFLQANSDERQGVLEKLFRTQRFGRIEHWMRDRTRELCERAGVAERRVAQLLATIANRVDAELPATLQEERLGDVGATAGAWSHEVLASARERHLAAAEAERVAQDAVETARAQVEAAESQARSLQERAHAERVLADLERSAEAAARDELRLDSHRSALLVQPLLDPLEELHRAHLDASAARRDALDALERFAESAEDAGPSPTDLVGCLAAARIVTDRLAVVRAARPREAALRDAQAELHQAATSRADLRSQLEAHTLRVAGLPAAREELLARLDDDRARARHLPAGLEALEAARAAHLAATRLPSARADHEELDRRTLAARKRAADARELHLSLVERRLAGMAAELAGQLAEGDPCQVCGSLAHPRPAEPEPDAVAADEQEDAQAEAERLRQVADQLSEDVADSARVLLAVETAASGLSEAAAGARLAAAQDAVAEAQAAVRAVSRGEEELTALAAEEATAAERTAELQEALTAVELSLAALRTTIDQASSDVAAAVGPDGGSVRQVALALETTEALLATAVRAVEADEAASSRWAEAVARADAEAVRQGFADVEEAASALLDADTASTLERRRTERAELRRSATALLATDPGPAVTVDVADAQDQLLRTTAELRARTATLGSAEQAAVAVAALVDQLEEALTTWEPLRREHVTAEAMSKLVRGLGTDNQLQMRLSSYVLATRLDQVLDAANERLGQMRDQRYALRRCGKARGGSRAGLGLEVMDTWTGSARAPSTLSGGETFVVSLALALGLADVVTQESGGMRVDTLFIDEGFGMLDPDTLDDVMDRIDALRAGGRTVGVVSHVTELRGRIPTQVHVSRGKGGSAVSVHTLVA